MHGQQNIKKKVECLSINIWYLYPAKCGTVLVFA